MTAVHDEARFQRALQAIDAANAEDPNTEIVDGAAIPKELIYGRRMTECLERLKPGASEALRLAARSQHIRRWEIPRAEYPMTRAGYHQWRTRLYKFHADATRDILQHVGYGEELIARVGDLLQKKNLRRDDEAQTLEDTAALVFLRYHLAEFAARPDLDEAKLVDILRKTWAKMSDDGHAAAATLELNDAMGRLVQRALSESS